MGSIKVIIGILIVVMFIIKTIAGDAKRDSAQQKPQAKPRQKPRQMPIPPFAPANQEINYSEPVNIPQPQFQEGEPMNPPMQSPIVHNEPVIDEARQAEMDRWRRALIDSEILKTKF